MFSSAASILGSTAQASYAAGNAFLDALAHHRRRLGLCGLSVNWGSWAQAGMAGRLDDRAAQRLESFGLVPMQPEVALQALEVAMQSQVPLVVILNADWQRLKEMFSGRSLQGEIAFNAISPFFYLLGVIKSL
jgi:hypothetical protein